MFDYIPVKSQFYGMKLLKDYSSADLRRIISIKEQIETSVSFGRARDCLLIIYRVRDGDLNGSRIRAKGIS